MIDASLVPKAATMAGWIAEICAQGIRRPGYLADRWAEQWVADRFSEFGLHNVRLEPVPCPYWEPLAAELRIGAGKSSLSVPCSAVPFSEPVALQGELALWDPRDPARVEGKVALYEITFRALPPTFPIWSRSPADSPSGESNGSSPGSRSRPAAEGWIFDPRNTFAQRPHQLPFAAELQNTMEPAIAAGAIGFVGVLRGYPGGGCDYYVPYDGEPRPIPGVYVGSATGDDLIGLLGEAPHEAPLPVSLQVEARRGSTTSHNVVGELPGADEDWVVIGTHHDAPWASAVEDASGMALVLAQAAYWSALPQQQRPHRLVFTANAAHMTGGRGTQALIERHRDSLDRIVLEIHLEHVARECDEVDGRLVPADEPVPRWWFTSEVPELENAVWEALVAEDLDRSLVLSPTALGERPTTDGAFFHDAGVPLVNYLTAPWYLFDAADTPAMIHEPSLEPVTRATIRIIDSTRGMRATSLRGR